MEGNACAERRSQQGGGVTMRLTCTVEGLEGNWVEMLETWTRADWQRLQEATVEDALALLCEKATACHIDAGDGKWVEKPDELKAAFESEAMDLALYGFLIAVPGAAMGIRRSLGNRSARLLSDSSAARS